MQAPTVPGHGAQQPQLQQADPNPFSCNVCQRSYTRIDHLARHFRSHTSEKPFTCGECGKDFARPDLLKRHVGSHGDAGSHSNKRQKVSQAARSRIQQACLTCAEAKLKCEGPAPCRRCQQKDLPCTYPESRQKKSTWLLNRPEPAVNVPLINESELTQQELPFNRAGASQVQYLHHTTSLQPLANASNAAFVRTEENAQAPAILGLETSMTFAPSGENLAGSAVSTIYEDRMFAEFLKDIMMPNTLNGDGRPTRPDHVFDYSTKDVLDFTVDTVFEMPDLLDISHQMPSDFSFQPARHNENAAGPCKSGCSTPAGRGGISLGAQAFRESLWLWTPAKEDFTQAEQPNLSIPSQEQMPEAQNSPLEAHVRSIDRIARDKILAMVLETCDASIVPRVVQSFPSCELLTNLMYNFLTYHSMITDSWIHVATFDSSLESPQMLSAVIAAGATQSHLPDIRKLGFAFVEASRDALVRMFERDNRHTRCLRPMQAMALQLDVGLWSGDRRKMEIAESLAQPLITMMRRGGRFRQPRQLPTPPQFDDDERTTEFKWLQWVEAESFRRFAFHMLIRDCHTSISLLNPPLLPHSEVSIEMPASRELWLARNATEWKALYLELFDGRGARLPSLRTCVDGFSLITQQRKLLDIDLVVMIILSGLWALVWQYREIITSVKHFNNSSVRNGPLITRLLYQETSQNLLHFKMAAHEWTGGMEPIAQALYERQMTHLYVSLEDVQLVAGKEGEDEARRVFPLLGAWVDSHESRLALWHAGQVIKTARGFRRSGLRSASAIALYHASLVMWAYSVASKSTEPPEDKDHLMTHLNGTEGSHLAVRLDGEDSPQVQRFLVLGVGIPAIGQGKRPPSVADGLVPINDAKRVMLATTSILREKNEVENLGCPPLVENLIKLMRSLGNAAQGMRRERSS